MIIIKPYIQLLSGIDLFSNIDENNISALLGCLGGKLVYVKKGEFIISTGDIIENIGILVEGQLHIIKENAKGERTIISPVYPGDLFAEALCFAGNILSPLSVVADTDAKMIIFNYKNMLRTCSESCEFHSQLIENMLQVVSLKNLHLQGRVEILSHKSIREKLMGYFNLQMINGKNTFTIPFNREELADFLCIDRSALSRELGRMKNEGIIDFWKSEFKMLEREVDNE